MCGGDSAEAIVLIVRGGALLLLKGISHAGDSGCWGVGPVAHIPVLHHALFLL